MANKTNKTASTTSKIFSHSGHFLINANAAAIATPTASTSNIAPATMLISKTTLKKNKIIVLESRMFLFLNEKKNST
jgi:hypothetical protein